MDDRGNAAPAVQELGYRVIVRKSEIARQAGMDDRGNAAPAVQECDFRVIMRDNEIIIESGNAAPAVHIKNEGGITVFLSDNEAIIERDNAASAVLPEDRIRLMVRGQDGNEVFYLIRRSTQLRSLMDVYCDRQAIDFNAIAFLFNGLHLRGEQTPDMLEMEDDDGIHAMFR